MLQNKNTGSPFVSVLMLTYNHEDYIVQALESILMQQVNFSFEIVIGDDCSTDKTREILLGYSQKYPEIIMLLFHEKNIGPMQNHIAVTLACKGKYVAMCEGDDYWTHSGKLQMQVDFLEANPGYSLTCHNIQKLQQQDGTLLDWNAEYFEKNSTGRELNTDNFFEPYLIATVSIVYRASCTDMEKIKQLKYFKDLFLFSILLSKGKGICFNKIMAVYRIHQKGIWSMQGNINHLSSNAVTAVYMSKYFGMKLKAVNLYAYHQSRDCLLAIENNIQPHRQLAGLLSYHLLFTFSKYSGLSKKKFYLKCLVKSFLPG